MREFTLTELQAAKALTPDELEALPAAALAAIRHKHLTWCDDCNHNRESCPCEWADEEITRHSCNCLDGWGGLLRTLERRKRVEETGSPWRTGADPRVECGLGADGRLVVRVYPTDSTVDLTITPVPQDPRTS